MILNSIRHLDALLRGESTVPSRLRGGTLDVPVVGLSLVFCMLGVIYGSCMGVFAVSGNGSGAGLQVLASSIKVPLLFVLTLVVTCPSLYVFNALFGSKLRLGPMLRLLVGSTAVAMAVLSSIGPITAFFGVSSASYAFMVLLNVVIFAVAGGLGLAFLFQTLRRMSVAAMAETEKETESANVTPESSDTAGAGPIAGHVLSSLLPGEGGVRRITASLNVQLIFRVWVLVFGLVGMQMAWLLRPFIGSPGKEFEWFRPRGGNFFEAVATQITKLFG